MTMITDPLASTPSRLRPLRWMTALGGTALLLLLLWLASATGSAPPRPSERTQLEARAAVLEAQLVLAKEGGRYLVLDPEAATLTFYQGGAALRSWPVLDAAHGVRRFHEEEAGWRTRRWNGARVEPAPERNRRVIVSDQVEPPDPTGAVDWIPPTPEEAVPIPHRFVVHFEGGLGVEVLAQASDTSRARSSLFDRVEQRVRGLLPANRDRYRVRLHLDASDAGSLYRSLPDASSFLAILPDP